ncbi:iron-sulfur cluster assembly accessory protein [Rhodoblastus sphagnicola]|uniref:Iron-sulfur cluster assembly accessory protein n=1 Tax=Rhodoblastus sphagnicola TaxID=333368 RepID=A0A2S6NCW1_9HYPH|nr:iron-sulfur cluster assembly accessory protein [Rhodoblastus sphagnicola]MBB4196306.1 iron-sulfur cluster assembly accessory protein [Rhodoblastus sphagnicola]PPQ32447.1 iron-sulfur cluster assembly accessory protein [Rhodoblastus sphagnicola]
MTDAQASEIIATDAAKKRVAEILRGEPQGSWLRISVNGGGCSGFQYSFDIAEKCEPDDIILAQDEARIAVDSVALDFMKGSTFDFVDDLMGSSFRVDNPNATASCGCGSSFAV